jgi:hypothetical protein
MSFITAALIVGGASLVGGAVAGSAARSAAKTQAGAAQQGIDAQERMFNRQTELQEPFRKAGEEALNKLIPLSSNYTPFGMSQFQADPGYGFRLSEGMKALDRTAAARGGLLSGATLKGAQRYGQDLASQEYTNAFNRYQTERNAQLNPLQSLAGLGQTATNTLTGAAGQMGQNYATGYGNIGQARASGYIGSANALNSALGTGLNYYQNQQYINRLPIPGTVGYGGAPISAATPYSTGGFSSADPYAQFAYGSST